MSFYDDIEKFLPAHIGDPIWYADEDTNYLPRKSKSIISEFRFDRDGLVISLSDGLDNLIPHTNECCFSEEEAAELGRKMQKGTPKLVKAEIGVWHNAKEELPFIIHPYGDERKFLIEMEHDPKDFTNQFRSLDTALGRTWRIKEIDGFLTASYAEKLKINRWMLVSDEEGTLTENFAAILQTILNEAG